MNHNVKNKCDQKASQRSRTRGDKGLRPEEQRVTKVRKQTACNIRGAKECRAIDKKTYCDERTRQILDLNKEINRSKHDVVRNSAGEDRKRENSSNKAKKEYRTRGIVNKTSLVSIQQEKDRTKGIATSICEAIRLKRKRKQFNWEVQQNPI